jgi:hypothetical protein
MRNSIWWKRLKNGETTRSHTMTMCLKVQHILLNNQIPPFLQPLYSPDFALCNLWLFPKTQDGTQTSSYVCREIQLNATGLITLLKEYIKRDASCNGMTAGEKLLGGEVQSFECDQVRLYTYISFLLEKSPKFWKHMYHHTNHTLMQAPSDICLMKMPEHVVTRQTQIFKLVMLAHKFPSVHTIFL